MAAIARRAPPGTIGHATGGSLMLTFAGVIIIPPTFAALHDRLDVSYGTTFGLLAFVSVAGIACVAMAWHSRLRVEATGG